MTEKLPDRKAYNALTKYHVAILNYYPHCENAIRITCLLTGGAYITPVSSPALLVASYCTHSTRVSNNNNPGVKQSRMI